MKNIFLFSLLIIPLITFSQIQIGADIDGEAANDNSGFSVSLSDNGNIVAIGAFRNDGNGADSGHVRVYYYDSGNWKKIGTDIDGEAAGDQFGFSVSLSGDGSIVAIGAPENDGNGSNSGHVRIYENIAGIWTQMGADINGEAVNDNFGNRVSLSNDGNIVAITAIYNAASAGSNNGHARIYTYSGGIWKQIGNEIDGEVVDGLLGRVSISNDGNIVALGNFGIGAVSGAGYVQIYENISEVWTKIGGSIIGEASFDGSGFSVSLSSDGSIVAIGAYGNDGNGSNSGHVRIYEFLERVWKQIGDDIDGEAAGDASGISVSLSDNGNIVAIGAWNNDGVGSQAGHARIYQNISGVWTLIGRDIEGEAANDFFGYKVSLSSDGSIVAIGGYQNDGNGSDSGYVQVYDLSAVVLGISDEFVVKNFSIYPNPVSTNLYIQSTNELEFISANLFDYLGKNVLKSTKTTINISSLSKGVYFLKVETDKGIGIKKVIIN